MSEITLYEKYGGLGTIQSLVRNFYADVLAEEMLKKYFQPISMERLIQHQIDFISQILGGPITYSGRTLREAHQTLRIKKIEFELVAKLLRENLEDFEVEPEDIDAIMTIVAGTLPEIVFVDEASQ